jgi:hypothetical protein
VYAFAFVQLYFMEHPYKVASYWIFDNVPAGSRLAGPHWDDKVPVSVAGKNPSMYIMEGRENELPVYERDTPAVIDLLAKRMSAADYLMFPTPRTPDSIPRIPEEYPNTTALLRLLWGEKLGFKLVYSTKNRPSLFGKVFNDDLADESFSVYDHPKVVVFQNVEKLSKDEILQRIKTWKTYEPLPSMNEMLLMDTGGWQPKRRLLNPNWDTFAKALSMVLILAGSVWVLTARFFKVLPDSGLGLSGLVGLFVAAGVAWLLGLAGLIPLTQSGAWFVVLLLGLLALARVVLRSSARAELAPRVSRHGVYALLAFLIGVIVVASMRSSDTDFFGLGEPVELAYLSYLAKSSDVYPQDIFKPGAALPVLFADRFALGWILKLVGIQPALALQAAYLVAGGILGAALYSLVVACVRRPKAALLGVAIAVVPAAYLLHALRDSKNQAMVQYDNLNLLKSAAAEQGFASWVRSAIKGTPCVVTACDNDSLRGLSALVGLPACVEPIGGTQVAAGAVSSQGELCKTEDAQVAFQRMMELGFEFFVTSSSGLSAGQAAPSRTGQFEDRPDLFAKVFDDGKVAVFVPSFSAYYPRHEEEPVSS